VLQQRDVVLLTVTYTGPAAAPRPALEAGDVFTSCHIHPAAAAAAAGDAGVETFLPWIVPSRPYGLPCGKLFFYTAFV